MKNDELEPCPFCGGEAGLRETLGTERHSDLFSVSCKDDINCCTVGYTFIGGNMYMMAHIYLDEKKKSDDAKQKAIDFWNTRPNTPQSSEDGE